ncbi:MAG: hypothetical protein ACRCZF_11750, partial [Gemmataceae bacterium]
MPSDSVSAFLDRATARRLLPQDVATQLTERNLPEQNLPALAAALCAQGLLTKFQAEAVQNGVEDQLLLANYPIIEPIDSRVGAQIFRALHPVLRTPLELWVWAAEAWTAEEREQFQTEAHAASALIHPHLMHMLDAGV